MKKMNSLMILLSLLLITAGLVNIKLSVNAATPVSLTKAVSENSQWKVTSPYDKMVVSENGMEFHYVAGDTWQGLMVVVLDPSRCFVGVPRDKYDGGPGASATRVAARYGAQFAVNGSFFVDVKGNNNGGSPIGFVISKGQMKAGTAGQTNTICGWDAANNFVVGTMTGQQMIARGIRDGVSCSPILVQNGAVGNLAVKSMTLMDARTCVGAMEDGTVLILTVDGRMSHSIGATTASLADCFLSFGAVSAGNLDGGGSTSVYYSGPTAITGLTNCRGGRPSPEAICVMPQ